MEVWVFRPNPEKESEEALLAWTKFSKGSREKALAFLRKHSSDVTCYAEIRVDGLTDYIGGVNYVHSSEWGFVADKLAIWKNER